MTTEYQTYQGLPPLAGLCDFKQAIQPGLSVDSCVKRLKRYHYAFKRLHDIFIARLTAEPVYELKMAFSYHGYLCSEQVTALRTRVSEMREPPLGLEQVPHPSLEILFDEILAAPDTETLLLGIYEKALPSIQRALEKHMADTNPLADQPSIRVCRVALMDIADMLKYGKAAVEQLVGVGKREQTASWLQLLDDCLATAGDLHGETPPIDQPVVRQHSSQPFEYDKVPRRDKRFPDPYNMGVNAEVFLYNEEFPPEPKVLMLYYKRLREIDVPEMMASIIRETAKKPWTYYRDMTRQLWDEARHAMMGEVGFMHLGVDWTRVMINFTWSLALNTQLTPLERHAVLYFIEQGLMPKSGKRFEWEVGLASHNPLAALFQDYDWADEVLHARIGRDWYLKEFDDAKQAVQYGDACWSKVLMDWSKWKEEGLTEHRNWWPELYRQACQSWGIEPDPRILAYNTTYEQVRADLKNISVSG